MLQSALALASRGLRIFPCKVGDKQPVTNNGFKDASADPAFVVRWWGSGPPFNIGVATGSASGVLVVDVDDEREGETSLRALETAHGALPPTVESITGKGRHIWFKMPDQSLPCSVDRIGPGIDVRADGGYVICPPSIHPSGRAYTWSVDSASAFANPPAWLLARALTSTTDGTAGGKVLPAPTGDWRGIVVNGAGEGVRDCTAARLTGYLLRHRVDPLVVLGLLHAWNESRCSPPLPAADIERIVDSICGKELKRRSAS
jgi:putative DNA primase/helicase